MIQYSVITSNGNYSIKQPLLTVGTSLVDFEGSLLGARLQSLAYATIIIGFITTLQSYFSKINIKNISTKN